jgi:hypothetical protein
VNLAEQAVRPENLNFTSLSRDAAHWNRECIYKQGEWNGICLEDRTIWLTSVSPNQSHSNVIIITALRMAPLINLRKIGPNCFDGDKMKNMTKHVIAILCGIIFCIIPQIAPAQDCSLSSVRCVGSGQEYSNIQAAVDASKPGDIVLIFGGTYRGFRVTQSGSTSKPIVIKAKDNDNVVINQAEPGGSGEHVRINNSSYITIEGLIVDRSGATGFGFTARGATATTPMHGLIIRGNTVRNSESVNLYVSNAADSLIENNITYGSVNSHGIYLANGGADNVIIRGNESYSNAVNGIHLNGDLSVGGDGLHSGITIENNRIHDNTANGMDLDGIQDSIIRNNLVYRNGRNAVRAFQIDAAEGPQNLKIYNNTIIVPAGIDAWAIKLTEDRGGHVIFDNILLNEGSSGGGLCVSNSSFMSDYNLVVSRMSYNGGNSILSLANWQTQSGQDTHSSITTSGTLFLDSSGMNFSLKSGSSAIDTGVASLNSISAALTDILSVVRPQGTSFDIGAYEYVDDLPSPALQPPNGLHIIY